MDDVIMPLAIAIGAVPGALLRFQITQWSKSRLGNRFPFGTLVINLTGCLLMGFFFIISQQIPGYPQELDLLIRTGFLGSYTTFSTYGFDTWTLWQRDRLASGYYWLGSIGLGLAAIFIGSFIGSLT